VQTRIDNVAVLIPAYNAAETIGQLLAQVLKVVPPSHVLVVNDGSTDNTLDIAKQCGVTTFHCRENAGKGNALRTGFEILKNNMSLEGIITIDADLQHRPEEICSFVERKKRTGVDIVIGRRDRIGTPMPLLRRLSNSITSFLVSTRTGKPIPDSQCGFRLIGRNVLQGVSIESPGFEAETEFLIRAARKGYTIDVVPIGTVYDGEESHMTNWKTTIGFVKVLLRDY
jgi:glycosyltransferase involved in cell wall biosynthesis